MVESVRSDESKTSVEQAHGAAVVPGSRPAPAEGSATLGQPSGVGIEASEGGTDLAFLKQKGLSIKTMASNETITFESPSNERLSIGALVSQPLTEQQAEQAVLAALGVRTLPVNFRFTNNAEDPAGRVVMLPGFLPQIELNLAKIGSAAQLADVLHEELIHPLQQDPAFKQLFDPILKLVTAEDEQRQREKRGTRGETYSEEVVPEEAVNEVTRRLANQSLFQRLVDWIVTKAKALFKIPLNRDQAARAAARIILREARANRAVQAATGERASFGPMGEMKETETVRHGIEDTATRNVRGRAERDAGVAFAFDQFAQAGLRNVHRGEGDILFVDASDRAFDHQPELEKLLERVKWTLENRNELPDFGNSFLDSVRELMAQQKAQLDRGEPVMFTKLETYAELTGLTRAAFSTIGQILGMMPRRGNEILEGAVNIATVITSQIDQGYFGGIGRRTIQTIINAIKTAIGGEITTDEAVMTAIENILTQTPPADPGGIVYKLVHGKLKPKHKAKLVKLLSNARVEEAVKDIIALAKENGVVEPPSKTIPLTPTEKLLHMVEPLTAAKVDELMVEAVRQAERNASRKFFESETSATSKDMAMYDAETLKEGNGGGIGPTPEQIEKGMNEPEFAHWRVIRDNLLGYSPVTDSLIQKVLKSEFKGVRSLEPIPKALDTRIDLLALSKSPAEEVDRVFSAYWKALEAKMDIHKASPANQLRIKNQITEAFVEQLQRRRTEFIDSFFNPKEYTRLPALERLQRLINAGIANDSRFDSDPRVKKLINLIISEGGYISADEVSRIATGTREEKVAWVQNKLAVISEMEEFNQQPDAQDYLEAVAFTYVAERLQAAEESITRRFLGGKDVDFGRSPPATPEQRAQRLEDTRIELEKQIRAGAFDASIIDAASKKASVQKLVPTIQNLIAQVMATPVRNQAELSETFASALVSEMRIDPAQADKAAAVLSDAYKAKFKEARDRALEATQEALDPAQREVLFTENKQLWQKISEFIHSGGLDDNDFFRAFAKTKGWISPTNAQIDGLRALVDEEDALRQLTPDEFAKVSGDPTKLAAARRERLKVTQVKRHLLHQRIEAMMKEWGAPTARNPWQWLTDPVLRRNWNAGRNELNSSNVLTGPAKFVRQLFDVVSFQLWYIPHRSIANTWAGFNRQIASDKKPDHIELFKNLGRDIGNALKIRTQTVAHSLRAFQQGLRGRGLPTHIEQLQSGMMMAERLNLRAEELAKKGDPASIVRSWLIKFWALQTLGHRVFSAVDTLQSKGAIWQEMKSEVIQGLREKGVSELEIKNESEDIFGNIATDIAAANNDAESILTTPNSTPTKGEVKAAAWELLQERIYAKIAALQLPLDNLEARNARYAQAISWNLPAGGLGGALFAKPARAVQKWFESYIPLPAAMFGNAMGTSLNRALTWTGFGLFPGMFKDDPFFETDVDKLHRRTEAITGLTLQAILGSLVMLGYIVVRLGWPKDKKDREEWQAKGISPYTVEIPLGGDKALKIPLRVGPLAPMAGGLAGASAMRTLMDKKIKEQEKLNQEAAKLGVEPGKATPIGASDLLGVAAQSAWQMMAGGRTAAGMLGTYSDYGNVNVGRIVSGFLSSTIPLLPAYQEMTRLAGVNVDPSIGSFWNVLVPSPWSASRRVNMLGDDVSTPGAVERVFGIVTLGGGIRGGIDKDNLAYSNLYATPARPSPIDKNKGYNFGGTLRPMTRPELAEFARLRGTNLKEALASLGSLDGLSKEDALSAVRGAIQSSDQRALSSIGVSAKTTHLKATPSTLGYSGRRSRTRSFRRSRSQTYGRIKRFKLPKLTGSRRRRPTITKRRRLLAA